MIGKVRVKLSVLCRARINVFVVLALCLPCLIFSFCSVMCLLPWVCFYFYLYIYSTVCCQQYYSGTAVEPKQADDSLILVCIHALDVEIKNSQGELRYTRTALVQQGVMLHFRLLHILHIGCEGFEYCV